MPQKALSSKEVLDLYDIRDDSGTGKSKHSMLPKRENVALEARWGKEVKDTYRAI